MDEPPGPRCTAFPRATKPHLRIPRRPYAWLQGFDYRGISLRHVWVPHLYIDDALLIIMLKRPPGYDDHKPEGAYVTHPQITIPQPLRSTWYCRPASLDPYTHFEWTCGEHDGTRYVTVQPHTGPYEKARATALKERFRRTA